MPDPPPLAGATRIYDRSRLLREAAMEMKVHANVQMLVTAAEEALKKNDFVAAANNYRLALSHRDDGHLRMKFEEADARARTFRFEKNIAPAAAAEKEGRWAEAAVFLVRAHEARPDADVAMRAANALRRSRGDLERGVALAEQAVALEPRNVACRLTLGELYLAANRREDAREAVAAAQQLAPRDARVKELASAVAQKSKV